jgi:hypothetical protein
MIDLVKVMLKLVGEPGLELYLSPKDSSPELVISVDCVPPETSTKGIKPVIRI